MVILIKRYGQLGNRLFLFAHLIANAIEHGYALANPSFAGYAPFFRGPASGDFDGLPIRVPLRPAAPRQERWLHRLLGLVQHPRAFRVLQRLRQWLPTTAVPELLYLPDDYGFDLNTPEYLGLAHSPRPVLLHGWCFRDRPSLQKHASRIRQLFTLTEPHRAVVTAAVQRARQTADVLVGVHIRRGDYATYCDGRYYYDNATYARLMHEVAAQFTAGTRVAFLVASDEPPAAQAFPGLQVHPAPGHVAQDMYALAGCDFLLGPPSSYSMWASFWGQVPLLHVAAPDQPVPLSQFAVYQDQE